MPPSGQHFIILLILPLTTFAYSTGAPEQVCKNLQPGEKMTKRKNYKFTTWSQDMVLSLKIMRKYHTS